MICDISSPSKSETDRTNSGGKTSGEKQQNRGGRVGVAQWKGSAAIKALKSRLRHSVALSGYSVRDLEEGQVSVCLPLQNREALRERRRRKRKILMSDTRCRASIFPPC